MEIICCLFQLFAALSLGLSPRPTSLLQRTSAPRVVHGGNLTTDLTDDTDLHGFERSGSEADGGHSRGRLCYTSF